MKNRVAFLFKLFLLIVLLVFMCIAVFAGVVWAKWPLWVCFFIVAGIIGVCLFLLFIQKLLVRKREQKFVSQIIEQDNASMKARDAKSRDESRQMQAKWKEAVEALRKSHLKKQGNPLYVLPWYMIIGGSGTGKTTAIKSANLSSSFAEVGSVSGISGTRNCDWWFFEQAILIDTAGRYAVRVDEERDREEWERFLRILAKYRKKEPLNGLIVTVSADSLNDSPESLERYGRDLRKRVDELMRVLDARFPVYVMVTKCDLVQGMTQFCDSFGDDTLGQAMGMINHSREDDASGFVAGCFKTMGERIRDLRMLILQKLAPDNVRPEFMLFPSELEKTRSGLTAFIKGVFQENPYQETPFFRGIFFSSGRQEGTPFSHFLKDMGLIGEQEVLPGTSRGLFLHDFFSKLLPADRGLFTRTQRGAAWARLTRNLGFAAWTAIILAVCGILSFSFVKNLHTIKTATAQFSGPQILKGELVSDVTALEQFRGAILSMEESNQSWWIPRLGLTESMAVESALKQKYCALMESRFLKPFDEKMADNMTSFSLATPVETAISHIEHLVRRINIIKAKLSGLTAQELTAMGRPEFDTVDIGAQEDIREDIQMKMEDLYLHYLLWQGDTMAMNQKMNTLQQWLARILTMEGADLKWLVVRTNMDPDLKSYTLADFWGKSVDGPEAKIIPKSFTSKGKQAIDDFMLEIESALTDSLIPAGLKREFGKWYKKVYIDAWLDFTAGFGLGLDYLRTREQWQTLANSVGHKKGPYFSLLDIIPRELAALEGKEELPQWVNLVGDINALFGQAATLRARKKGSSGVIDAAVSRVKAIAPGASGAAATQLDAQAMLKAGKSFMIYQDSLAAVAPGVASQRAAFDLATEIYSQDPATGESPFFTARREMKKLPRLIVYPGKEAVHVWEVLKGPLSFFQEFALREASCQIQKKWETEVLMEMRDVSDDQNLNTLLMGPEGFVTRFVKGPCKPFIKRGLKKGFHAARVDQRGLAFDPYFFKFLTRGVAVSKPAKSSYTVKIGGLPTSANEEAQVQPHATLLELICSDKTIALENLNFPVQKVFSWSPKSECEVMFTIKIGSLDLVKKYSGRLSFPKFIKDFASGEHRFFPKDFPDHEDSLVRMGVKQIKVKYRLRGHEPVAKLLTATPGKTPMEIVSCWE